MIAAPGPTLVVTSTFPQHPGDHRGHFLLRHWERRAAAGERVRFLVPRTAWSFGQIEGSCEIVRFAYAPAPLAQLTGRFGALENLRERPWRALLVPAYLAGLALALRRELARARPARIVTHFLLPSAPVVLALAAPAGVACEVHGHGTDVDVALRLPAPLRRRLFAGLQGAARVALPSQEKLDRLTAAMGLTAPPSHFVVDTMAADLPAPAPLRPPLGERRGVLFVGRLIRQKGIDTLLHALARLGPGVPLEIAGDGPERPRLERLARDLAVDARFHGFVDPARRDRLYRRAAVLAVPSRDLPSGLSEGAPLVICEARAHGLPVVASAVGGIPELCAGDPLARLIPPGDPAALARALAAHLRPPAAHAHDYRFGT